MATSLLGANFPWQDLTELQSEQALAESGRLLALARARGLRPPDAAEAIRMAAHLFGHRRREAGARGWPLRSEALVERGGARHEAYFLELLTEALEVCGPGRARDGGLTHARLLQIFRLSGVTLVLLGIGALAGVLDYGTTRLGLGALAILGGAFLIVIGSVLRTD